MKRTRKIKKVVVIKTLGNKLEFDNLFKAKYPKIHRFHVTDRIFFYKDMLLDFFEKGKITKDQYTIWSRLLPKSLIAKTVVDELKIIG